jgi:uncharacterized protein YpuA (DUF1002 family)
MFEWGRIHKWEENHERNIIEDVEEYVCEYYEVDDIFNLTEEQVNDITNFRNNDLNEYSVMQVGFNDILNRLDDPDFYDEDEDND